MEVAENKTNQVGQKERKSLIKKKLNVNIDLVDTPSIEIRIENR